MYIFKNILFVFTTVVLFSLNLNSQCQISSIELTNVECVGDASYSFNLNFVLSGNTLDSFEIYSNELLIRRYSTQELPIEVINNKYSGQLSDTIRIKEISDSNCVHNIVVDNPCECSIFDVLQTVIDCTDSTYYSLINFKHFNSTDSFELGHPEQSFGAHPYAELPLKIGPFKKDTTYFIFIADKQNFLCFQESEIEFDECPMSKISDIEIPYFSCNEDYNKILTITFNHINTSSKGYTISLNDEVIDTFEYQNNLMIDSLTIKDSIVIGPFDIECNSDLIVTITDLGYGHYEADTIFDNLCCEKCEIGGIEVRDRICVSDSTYDFILDFEYAKNKKDSFSIYYNNILYSKHSLSEIPLQINQFNSSNDFDSLTVCMDDGRCCNSIVFETPFCDYFGCTISNVEYNIKYDSIGKYWVDITKIEQKNTSESFSIRGNGNNYGEFNYSDIPFTLGEFLCRDSLDLEFVFKDSEVDDCKFVIEAGKIVCPFKVNNNDINISNYWVVFSRNNKILITSNYDILQDRQIEIYDILGHKITHKKTINNTHETSLTLNNVKTGVYLILLKGKGIYEFKKIFIQP